MVFCRIILEVDPQIIAQRVSMRPDTEGDGAAGGYGEQVRSYSLWLTTLALTSLC